MAVVPTPAEVKAKSAYWRRIGRQEREVQHPVLDEVLGGPAGVDPVHAPGVGAGQEASEDDCVGEW